MNFHRTVFEQVGTEGNGCNLLCHIKGEQIENKMIILTSSLAIKQITNKGKILQRQERGGGTVKKMNPRNPTVLPNINIQPITNSPADSFFQQLASKKNATPRIAWRIPHMCFKKVILREVTSL